MAPRNTVREGLPVLVFAATRDPTAENPSSLICPPSITSESVWQYRKHTRLSVRSSRRIAAGMRPEALYAKWCG
jgi:hypothetical protein